MHNTKNVYQKGEEVCTRTHTLEEPSFSSYQHVLIYPQQPSSSFSGQSSAPASFLLHQAVNLYVHLTVLQYGQPISILAAPLFRGYRGITSLNITCKVLSNVLRGRAYPYIYAKDNLGDYQRGFWYKRLTTDEAVTIRQLLEKSKQLFVDFRQVCDSITRESIWQVLENIGVP